MKELRCTNCNKLLLKHEDSTKLEIVCPRCKEINVHVSLELIKSIKKY